MKSGPDIDSKRLLTGEPDGAATEAPAHAHNLPSLVPRHMMDLLCHVGGDRLVMLLENKQTNGIIIKSWLRNIERVK